MKFLGNYLTISSKGDELPFRYVCFARTIPYHVFGDQVYNVWIIKNPDYGFNAQKQHCCQITLQQLKSLVRCLRSIYPFTCSISNTNLKEGPAWKVSIKINCNKYSTVLFILTALRYAYEFPYCCCLKEAFKLTKLPVFKFFNIITLCNLIESTIFKEYHGTNHGFSRNCTTGYTSIKDIKNGINKSNSVFGIFPQDTKFKVQISPNNRNTTEYWDSEEEFNKRVELYIQNINSFIKK